MEYLGSLAEAKTMENRKYNKRDRFGITPGVWLHTKKSPISGK